MNVCKSIVIGCCRDSPKGWESNDKRRKRVRIDTTKSCTILMTK